MFRPLRFPVFLAVSFALALLLTACVTTKDSPKEAGEAGKTAPLKVGEELVRALVENDADAFLRQLPENLRKEFGEKDFEKTRSSMIRELGTPVSYTYLRNMAHPVATISLWVIRFERTPSDKDIKEKKLVMEVLFRAVYGKIDGKETLLSFNFY
ncbi:MAG: hypothetical protein J6331_00335 [Lentisphaeria bacterium]|nr:hypothetical protein [Lentisphaeria bacterium]